MMVYLWNLSGAYYYFRVFFHIVLIISLTPKLHTGLQKKNKQLPTYRCEPPRHQLFLNLDPKLVKSSLAHSGILFPNIGLHLRKFGWVIAEISFKWISRERSQGVQGLDYRGPKKSLQTRKPLQNCFDTIRLKFWTFCFSSNINCILNGCNS